MRPTGQQTHVMWEKFVSDSATSIFPTDISLYFTNDTRKSLLRNTNKKSYVVYLTVTWLLTLSDLLAVISDTGKLYKLELYSVTRSREPQKVNISETMHDRDIVSTDH